MSLQLKTYMGKVVFKVENHFFLDSRVILLGEAHGHNHPPWPGTLVATCMSCLMTGGPGKKHGTNKAPPNGRFGKGQKEIPCVRPPLAILLCGIHLGLTRRAPPGRTLSQTDLLQTTGKLIPSP